MKELNIFQRILFSIHSIITMIWMILGIYFLFVCLFLLTRQVWYLSIIPIWFGIDYYKHQTLKNLGYKMQLPVYNLQKSNPEEDNNASESDKIEE